MTKLLISTKLPNPICKNPGSKTGVHNDTMFWAQGTQGKKNVGSIVNLSPKILIVKFNNVPKNGHSFEAK